MRTPVKTTQSQSYKFKKIGKSSNFEILQAALHKTHLLKLLDKKYEYAMNPTKTVVATVQNGHTMLDGRTDGWIMDIRTETNIPP